ncbi:MAG TPA: hypothetical protein VH796_13630 [Nitrososphaeraceae archaeon]
MFDNSNDNDGINGNGLDILVGDKMLIPAGSRPRIPSIAGLKKD